MAEVAPVRGRGLRAFVRRAGRAVGFVLLGYGLAVACGMRPCLPFDYAWNVGNGPFDASLCVPASAKPKLVVLQHGLWRTEVALSRLARALEAHGYRVCNEGYDSTDTTIEAAAAKLAREVDAAVAAAGGAVDLAFVGHSLGGLVIEECLRQRPAFEPFACVYVAVPHSGAVLCDLRKHWWPFPWIMGTGAALQLSPGDAVHARPIPFVERSGAIVGDRGEGNASIPGRDDGTVAVAEATLAGAADTIVVPRGHTSIASADETIRQVLHFLQTSRFAH